MGEGALGCKPRVELFVVDVEYGGVGRGGGGKVLECSKGRGQETNVRTSAERVIFAIGETNVFVGEVDVAPCDCEEFTGADESEEGEGEADK